MPRHVNRRYKFIVFAGIDGSGKSTQAQLLSQALQAQGHRVSSLWGRRVPWLTRLPAILLKKCVLRESGKSDGADYAVIAQRRKKLLRHGAVKFFWSRVLLLEYALRLRFRTWRLRGAVDYLIVDRYLVDALVDLAAAASDPANEMKELKQSLVTGLFRAPDLMLIIDLAPEMGWQRKQDGTSLEYLKDRRPLYLEFAKGEPNTQVLDGAQPSANVQALVRRHVENL